MKRLSVLMLLIPFITTLNLHSQGEISLLVKPDTNLFVIGEQVNLNIILTHPKNVKLNIPELTKNIDPKLEIVSVSDIDTSNLANDLIRLKQEILITSFDTGISIVSPLPFEIDFGAGKKKDTLFSRPVYFLVLTMALDTTNAIFDIKEQYKMNYTFEEFITSPYLYISMVAIILGILVYYFYGRLKNREKPVEKTKPTIPAHVVAIKALDELKSEKLWQQNKTKEYYSRLTEIIRNYIELRFNINALEKTSTEIIMSLQNKRVLSPDIEEHLKALLSLADLVKFAKGTTLPDENEQNMDSAYDFVRKTKLSTNINTPEPSPEGNVNDVEPLNREDNDA